MRWVSMTVIATHHRDASYGRTESKVEKSTKMTDIVTETKNFISDCWERVFSEVCDTVVYIDQFASECLHWHTGGKGYLALRNAGAIAVHELGMYRFRYYTEVKAEKAVIVSTASDPAFYQRTIKMILAKNAFHSCTIFCGIPCCTTDYLTVKGEIKEKLNYAKLKKNVEAWMSSDNLSQEPSVNVIHVPLFLAFLSKNLFVTPPFADAIPPLDSYASNVTYDALNFLAYSFQRLFDAINARVDVYSIGELSDYLAESLENYGVDVNRRDCTWKDTKMEVSLVLVDRTLDLCTPTSSSAESFLTRILRTFPRLPCHNNDVAINLSPMFGTVGGVQRAFEVPGCLASMEKATLDLFVLEKEKRLLAMANRSLTDIVSTKDSPKLKTPTRISGHSLEKVLSKFRTANDLDSATVCTEKIQRILAIVEGTTSPKIRQLELLTSLEKLALQNLSVSRESSSILAQLSNVVRTRIQRGLDVENLLALLIHVYALAGTQIRFSAEQELQLEESLAHAVYEDFVTLRENPSIDATAVSSTHWLPFLLLESNDTGTTEETSRRIARRIVNTLRLVAQQRSTLQDYRHCMIKPNGEETVRRVGLLERITRDVCCSTGMPRELKDLRRRSSSLVSAGFSLFSRGKTKRHPCDNCYVLIYVIGGVTSEEAKVIEEITSTRNDNEDKTLTVMLGGSRLLNPLDVVDKILFDR
ncbi:sec1 family domain-containing protein 2 isoform X2 [Calliopsis andreniformis]|uniref:sec1 family domain-containing protein 2 isoform X2 n=1 Tax=Calliopsis andreniformis TaxID=337506 RepID=UPI003FCD3B25